MKIDGLHLLEGSQITNPVVANGAAFPIGPTNPPDIGEIFYLTSGDVGLHYCSATDGTNGTWVKIASAEMDADLVAIASLVGTTGLLKKTAADTWTLDTTAYATEAELNAVAGKLAVGTSWPLAPEDYQIFYATLPISGSPIGFYYWDPVGTSWTPIEPAAASWDALYGTPTTLSGYGITNAYTKTETDNAIAASTPTFASLTGKPTTLSGYGITDAQPLDGDLSSIAGLSGTSGILTKTAADTWSLDTNTYLTSHPSVAGATSANNSGVTFVQDLTFDANGHVTGIQSVSVPSGSTSQEGIVQLSDSISTTSSSLGATSTAVKSAYDIGAAALPKSGGSMTGSIVIPTGQYITLTDAPVSGTDAVNKNYVDGNLAGLSWKNSVKAASNGNITLSGTQTVDGIALIAGDRVLVKNQTSASQNGIYVVAAGAWARSTDMDSTTPINEVNSAAVFVEQGTVFTDTGWTQVNNVSTLDTDDISFTQFNGASGITAGVGLVKSGNTIDVNLGAGVSQLPTDEVGIDVYTGGGLMTTVDGTASSTLTNAQLSLTKVGTAGTYKSVTTDDYGRIIAGTNPTTLAGYGITDAQALDADLTAIAALAGTSGFLKKTATDTWSLDTTTYATDSLAMHLAGAETATGLKTFSAGIKLPDASNFYLGTDNDLGLSHSGTAGTITNATGTLTISTSTGNSLLLRCNNTSGSYINVASADANVYANTFSIRTQNAATTMLTMNTGGASFSASVGSVGNMNCQATVTCSDFYTRGYIPLLASNGDLANNNFDRGWEFKWHNGTVAKLGFFGFDRSTGKFTFVPDATINTDIVTGTKGTIDAFLAWADVTGKPTTLAGYGITDAVSSSHLTDETLHLTTSQNTWIDAITATSDEVNYLSGVTSAIQTQLDAKFAKTGGTIAGNVAIYTTGNASMEMGRIDGTSATPYIDFHSGATATDYDSRIIASGGNGTNGQGTLSIIASGGLTLTGPITASNTINGTTIPTSKTLLVTDNIGSSVQAYDADLSAIGALVGTSGTLIKTAANTWSLDTTAYAVDNTVVHLAGTETITGAKTFSTGPLISNADNSLQLNIQSTSSTASRWPGLAISNYNSGFSGGFPVLELRSSRGSSGTPTAVQSGDILGSIAGWGYNGTGFDDVARIYFKAASTFDGITDDGQIEFHTQSGTTLTKRMQITATGNIDFYPGSILGNFYMGSISSNPIIGFDNNDYLSYNRTANSYNFFIGGTNELSLTSSTATFGGSIVSNAITATGMSAFINGTGTSGAEIVEFKGTDYGPGNPYMYIKHSASTGNEYFIGLWDGTSTAGVISFASKISADRGIELGATVYPTYEVNLDFGSDVANTWRKIIGITCANTQYSTHGFIVEVFDPQANHAPLSTTGSMKHETYYVACSYSNDTTIGTPDSCSVSGPSSRIRAVKTAAGVYEVQVQNLVQYSELKIKIHSYASNSSHTINYYDGATIGTPTATYNATTSGATDLFQEVEVKSTTASTSTSTGALVVSGGVGIAGDTYVGGHVSIPDNKNLYIGTGNDLYAIHDGTNSSIINQTGNLSITNNNASGSIISAITGGSNLELWGAAAYLDATTTYIRNQAGSTNFVTISSSNVKANVPILVSSNATVGQVDIVNGSASTWYKSIIRNDGTNWYFLTTGLQTSQALAEAASWNSTRPLTINLATGAITLDSTGATGTNIGGDLTIGGNLTVNGTTTTINATTLTVDDKNIELGSVTTPTNTTADGGGITLRGTTDKTIIWDNANNNWTSSENWNLVTGKAFKINNVSVLTATTLGSSVVSSSLTSVGTITSGVWNAGAVTSSGVVTGTSVDTTYGRTTSGTLTTTAVTQVEVPLSLSATVFRTVEYLVQATTGTTYHTSKVHVIHDGTNTWVNEYSIMWTNASLYTVTADVSGGNVRLLVTPASATSTTFRVVATAIDI